jgi:hypothetical protein
MIFMIDSMSLLKYIGLIIFTALAAMVTNVLVHVLFMVVYSYLIVPGRDEAYYQEIAMATAPYSSIIAGMPIFYFLCLWAAKKFPAGKRLIAALLIWLVYFTIDLTIIVLVGEFLNIALLFSISFITKFAAAYLAGIKPSAHAA